MKQVHIIINPKTGLVEFEVQGMSGGKCVDITSALAKGHETKAEQLTEEFYEPSELPQFSGE